MTEKKLALLLRIIGSIAVTAVVPMAMPFAWMDATHRWLGLGALPDVPIVAYLARSTSAFYAMSGGLMWVVASDLRRYAHLVRWLGLVTIAFGCALVAIDWTAGLPSYWTLTEGPFSILYGLIIYFASRRLSTS